MRKVLLLVLFACLLPSCRSGRNGRFNREAAEFTQGEAQFAEGRYDAAAISFERAREAAERMSDRHLLARSNYALAETYNRAFFYDEGLVSADSAWHQGLREGLPLLADSALYQMALSQIGLEDYPEASRLFDCLLEVDSLPDNLAAHATSGKAFLAIEQENDPAKALRLFEEALSMADAFDSHEYWAAYAYCLAANGYPEQAVSVFQDMEQAGYSESYAFQAWLSRTYALQGNWAAAFHGMNRAAERQRSAISRIVRQASFKAQRDYLALKNQQASARSRARAIIMTLICSILFLSILLLFLLLRFRNRENQAERASLLEWAASLEDKQNDLVLSQKQLQKDYARIYQSYFHQIGRISEIVGEAPDKETGVFFQLRGLIKDIRLDKKGQRQFESMINHDLENIMQHFREDFPRYHEDTYRFISYVFAGFDATTIRLLTGMASDAAVHTKKSGIKKTVLASGSIYKDYYRLFL